MSANAQHYIHTLGLAPHPEGGSYREIHRSAQTVLEESSGKRRAACTQIYYLLPQGEISRWHRVAQDEVWHFYDGVDLELFCLNEDMTQLDRIVLGQSGAGSKFVHIIPAGCWQAARPLGAFSLLGCTVAPAFEFGDFQLLRDDHTARQLLAERHPELVEFA